jgi:hypothetical protein
MHTLACNWVVQFEMLDKVSREFVIVRQDPTSRSLFELSLWCILMSAIAPSNHDIAEDQALMHVGCEFLMLIARFQCCSLRRNMLLRSWHLSAVISDRQDLLINRDRLGESEPCCERCRAIGTSL